ncbi:hypothetical protein A8H39_01150 [Paraburkholderia fungorum]|uniref:hypothetical protein n=1 Tax=Paraburkholderia fungorum TaxID=134537 RepID=UPI000480CE1B|nr:hypothetical protein [Paraburkholderia fungorum]PNE59783.1 hypothetical protein A8H39_01150 [Paraburkholderia fungorum]
MKTLQYQGFVPGYYAQCAYTFRVVDEIPTLVLKQDPDTSLFLDNSIEAVVTGLLDSELADVDAARLRVFRMDSSHEWSEIRFETLARLQAKRTWRQRVMALFCDSKPRGFVEVSDPSWSPIEREQREFLESLDPLLAVTPTPSRDR